jgi:hypothetical protein
MMAVHVKDEKTVAIIDLEEENNQADFNKDNKGRTINYFNEDITNLDVKISEDFSQAVLVN